MRVVALFISALAMAGGTAAAQTSTASEENGWSLDASAYTYIVPDSENYVQPTVAADRDWLHLEARFNYEDRDTGSVWLGYNFSVGEEVTFEITPMVGAVIGSTDGIAPGYKASLRWRMLDLYSETEYVVDAGDSADSFQYPGRISPWHQRTGPASAWQFSARRFIKRSSTFSAVSSRASPTRAPRWRPTSSTRIRARRWCSPSASVSEWSNRRPLQVIEPRVKRGSTWYCTSSIVTSM